MIFNVYIIFYLKWKSRNYANVTWFSYETIENILRDFWKITYHIGTKYYVINYVILSRHKITWFFYVIFFNRVLAHSRYTISPLVSTHVRVVYTLLLYARSVLSQYRLSALFRNNFTLYSLVSYMWVSDAHQCPHSPTHTHTHAHTDIGYFRWSQQLKILKSLKIFLHLVFYEKNMILKF